MEAEYLTVIIVATATVVLYLLNKYRNNLLAKAHDLAENLEDVIEDKTGLDVELSDAIDEVVDDTLNRAEDVLEDAKDDGKLEESLSDVAEDLVNESKDKLTKMTVAQIKQVLKEKGLPLNGKKNELIERLLNAGDE
tara:strand:+ start:4077 stop:4487 length:411 start_codon:yes stop_codon:yes gene_type:complete